MSKKRRLSILIAAVLASPLAYGNDGPVELFCSDLVDEPVSDEARAFYRDTAPSQQPSVVEQTMLLQQTPFGQTLEPAAPQIASSAGGPGASTPLLAGSGGGPVFARSLLRPTPNSVAAFGSDLVLGTEAVPLISTDLGSLLGKAPAALSVGVQKRTPIVNDPRVRGSRIGSLAASGSHWVPARADLDSVVGKIDSRLVDDVLIVPGPYSSLYGPGFQFVDFQLQKSPRFNGNRRTSGRTAMDHQANGNQWLGLQSISTGGANWGISGNYTHRFGSDYRAGDGSNVASSYDSREFTVAMGRDFSGGRSAELSLLRLDQSDVEFPGYVFDIDSLVTDAYGISFTDVDPGFGDLVETEFWYNRTRFTGDAQSDAKREQFPFLDSISYTGVTDVDSMSTGYRRARTWGEDLENGRLTIGHDLRFIKQELNEIASGVTRGLPLPFTDRNSPIPRSFSVNPGLFAEYNERFLDDYVFRAGGRIDYVQTDIVADPGELDGLGLEFFPTPYENIVGTDQSQTDRVLASLYGSVSRRFSPRLITSTSIGYAEKPPGLTELYAAQPFLLLLQNGLNAVTGDPRLKRERLIQADFSVDYDGDSFRGGFRGFYGWHFDYITLENTRVVPGGLGGEVQQVSLRYVNTSLATIAGFESFAELFPKAHVTPFVNMRFVDGRDRTRNGDFATSNGDALFASEQVSGLDRGAFSGVEGSDSESLPGIPPLETRIGFRIKDDAVATNWNLEFAARIVDNQDRVATSLLENETSGFTVFDIRGFYVPEFMPGMTMVAGVENFTDKTYREHLDFRSLDGVSIFQPGVNFYFGTDLVY